MEITKIKYTKTFSTNETITLEAILKDSDRPQDVIETLRKIGGCYTYDGVECFDYGYRSR